MTQTTKPYKVPLWARVLAGIVVLLGCGVALASTVIAAQDGRWPFALRDVPDLAVSASVLLLFAYVAVTGRVPWWADKRDTEL